MSLVDSDHVSATSVRRDCHYRLKDGKPSMAIWSRDVAERNCPKCYRGAYPHEKVCPRCGEKLDEC